VKELIKALVAGTALLSLAGCNSTGSKSSDIVVSALGNIVDTADDGTVKSTGVATAKFATDKDGNIKVTLSTDDSTDTTTFAASTAQEKNETSGDYTTYSSDNGTETTYLTALGDTDTPEKGAAAFISVEDSASPNTPTFLAFRSEDGVTDSADMPGTGSGSAKYIGTLYGGSNEGGSVSNMTGTATIDVNFDDGSVAGTFDIDGNDTDITFTDGKISGSTYNVASTGINYGAAEIGSDSYVEGAFYGSDVGGTAGTFLVQGDVTDSQNNTVSATAMGAFQATKQ
jgi:hypothetical protein